MSRYSIIYHDASGTIRDLEQEEPDVELDTLHAALDTAERLLSKEHVRDVTITDESRQPENWNSPLGEAQ